MSTPPTSARGVGTDVAGLGAPARAAQAWEKRHFFPLQATVSPSLSGVSLTYCRDRIVSAPGQMLSLPTLEEDRRRLIRTGRFLEVTYTIEEQGNSAEVIFSVVERPVIAVESTEPGAGTAASQEPPQRAGRTQPPHDHRDARLGGGPERSA